MNHTSSTISPSSFLVVISDWHVRIQSTTAAPTSARVLDPRPDHTAAAAGTRLFFMSPTADGPHGGEREGLHRRTRRKKGLPVIPADIPWAASAVGRQGSGGCPILGQAASRDPAERSATFRTRRRRSPWPAQWMRRQAGLQGRAAVSLVLLLYSTNKLICFISAGNDSCA
jgi:hypothetical protein